MKIVLSSYWRISCMFMALIELFTFAFALRFYIYSRSESAIVIMLCVIAMIVCCTISMVFSICFLTCAIIGEDKFDAYLFKKKLCTVYKDKPIFYVIFEGVESSHRTQTYILLSNEPFEIPKRSFVHIFPWNREPLCVSYNMKTQIAMPYNEKTIPILEIDKWHAAHYSTLC